MKFDEMVETLLEAFPQITRSAPNKSFATMGNTWFTGTPSGFKGNSLNSNPNEVMPKDASALFYQKKPSNKKRKKKS